MKRLTLLGLFICCFIFTGCGQNLGENESIYEGELVIAGIGPKISFEPTIEEGTLALKGSFEDHSDHIFFSEGIWEEYLKDESEYLPGNTVKFKGVVEAIDGAAGNHYYNVKSVDKLKLIKYPNAEEIKEIFDSYNYCESDLDCEYFGGECPLGCYIPMNKVYVNIANSIASNFVNHLDERCVYDCMAMNKAVCKNYKCEMINSDIEEKEVIYCSSKQKTADICTMQYDPVCGSDGRTYDNNCVACASETVESYTKGECESSAFSVEGDSKYLREAEKILEKNGAVTCNLFYTNFGKQIHALFIADNNRFYSAVDDYSDNYSMNQTYTLTLNGKKYYRSTFPDADNIVEDYNIDIESEIASLLMDTGKYPDFEMNCYEGIDVADEHLFTIPNF